MKKAIISAEMALLNVFFIIKVFYTSIFSLTLSKWVYPNAFLLVPLSLTQMCVDRDLTSVFAIIETRL